jgi:hypothetical protein
MHYAGLTEPEHNPSPSNSWFGYSSLSATSLLAFSSNMLSSTSKLYSCGQIMTPWMKGENTKAIEFVYGNMKN